MVTDQDKAILFGMLEAHNGEWKLSPPRCDVCYCAGRDNSTLRGWLNAPTYQATVNMPLRLCKPHAVELDLLW